MAAASFGPVKPRPDTMPKRLAPSLPVLRATLLLAAILSLFGAPSLHAADASAPAPSLKVSEFSAAGIETVALRPAEGAWLAHLPARVTIPNAQLRLVAAPVSGLVTAVLVGVGDPVEVGQHLAILMSAEVIGLQRDLAQASAERERAARALARDEALLAEGLIPASRAESSRAADRQAAAQLAERRDLLRLAGAKPGAGGEIVLKSPIDGVLLSQDVRAGERVEPATALFRIGRLAPLALEIDLPVRFAGMLAPGQAVRIPATGAQGKVVAIGHSVGAGQTIVVRGLLESRLDGLDPGQQVEAEVAIAVPQAGRPLWRVPASAVTRPGRADSAPIVFVRRGDAYVTVPIEPISESGGDFVVRGELAEGEPVVARGASQLKAALGASRAE
ncbi:efflux RND transporter periplasmic adaptor subunit [Burkholderiaceae bacterium FT117]|uniref:efflux RND transporter periplasmic adaptor subunit n=1 Tax=Zeimonas sediminis TaxID=2944268 RepID=UPI002342DA19|nr:efflux RND transporter periplasmic adaptor subunit [Zeimonas sediminis]MCM5569411.1 efflux RND transporter periplasmic adaptor subunit [Zeimonas sediminis]